LVFFSSMEWHAVIKNTIHNKHKFDFLIGL
jgi:hypothetical protein